MVELDDRESGYRFDGFELLPKSRLLLRGGEKVQIGRRALSILLVLIERHERVVTKDEILDEAFPGVFVEEQNVTVHISTLRQVLGPAAIATIPGRGYRFAAKLERRDGAADTVVTGAAPPSAIPPASTNLPHRPPLIGRAAELAELPPLAAAHRLVTLVGPGGMGKSSLAIEFGRQIADRFPDGVWLIDLAPLTDPLLVASAVAAMLGVMLRGAEAPAQAIGAAIARKTLLLIFDNCEHVIAAAAELASALLNRAPGLRVLATSQEILGVPAELVYRLDPLALPPLDPRGGSTADARIAAYGAVALFVARAGAADRHFRLQDSMAATVSAICRALDGVPLALEMAAARLPLLGLEGLRTRLDERLRLLRRRATIGGTRYDTLQGMVEWSHGLLQPDDQRVFRRLGVFRGSFSLDAAIAVAAEPETDQWSVIDGLSRLIDKSLVAVEGGETPRYRLLETFRLYAIERLRSSDEYERVQERSALYFVKLFDQAETLWEAIGNEDWLAIYQSELDNIRSTVDWALQKSDRAPVALTLLGNAARLWYAAGLVAEGRAYVDRTRAFFGQAAQKTNTAQLLRQAGHFWFSTDAQKALLLLEEASEYYRQLNDKLNFASVLAAIGNIHCLLGSIEKAKTISSESYEILRGSRYYKSTILALNGLGFVASMKKDDIPQAENAFAEAAAICIKLKDTFREGAVRSNLADMKFCLGLHDSAIEECRQAIAALRVSNRRLELGIALCNMAGYLVICGNVGAAMAPAIESLRLVSDEGGYALRSCLEQWAIIGCHLGKHHAAARIAGFVDAANLSAGARRNWSSEQYYHQLAKLLADGLPAGDVESCAAEGARWTEQKAVAFVKDEFLPYWPVRPD
jgi:predicted ATPase/DNA-binding winged helix-turn-helix (wHTH) protein